MFDVLENGRVLSSHEHLWQAPLVFVDNPANRKIVEVDGPTNQVIRTVSIRDIEQALTRLSTATRMPDITQ